jgi:hypothetical protein
MVRNLKLATKLLNIQTGILVQTKPCRFGIGVTEQTVEALILAYKKYKRGVSTRLSGPSWSVTPTQREKLTYCLATVLASVRK